MFLSYGWISSLTCTHNFKFRNVRSRVILKEPISCLFFKWLFIKGWLYLGTDHFNYNTSDYLFKPFNWSCFVTNFIRETLLNVSLFWLQSTSASAFFYPRLAIRYHKSSFRVFVFGVFISWKAIGAWIVFLWREFYSWIYPLPLRYSHLKLYKLASNSVKKVLRLKFCIESESYICWRFKVSEQCIPL